MLKILGWILKASLFSLLVLVAAHYITWDGKTVSDQVASTLSSAERSSPIKKIHRGSEGLIRNMKKATRRIGIEHSSSSLEKEAIPANDRARLQALIHSSNEG